MDVEIAGVGRGSDIHSGPCRLTLRSENHTDEDFIRALHAGIAQRASVKDGAVLIDRMRAIFEGAGWKEPVNDRS